MDNNNYGGLKNPITTQEEFNETVNAYMERGEEEALFALLREYPEFMCRYAGDLEKELGL
ncbi:MAG TPA: hypothetical protein DF613_03345 [Lachnospiraceae bacterium]|nr:hypothetical protein [Lachnospiraceae bacterium]